MTIIAPDLEALLVRHLAERFPDYRVATEVPPGRISKRLITVVAMGAPQLNDHVDQAHVNVFVFHPDPQVVMDDALAVQAFLNGFRSPAIRDVSASYPSRTGSGADEESPRRYLYADIRLRKDIR